MKKQLTPGLLLNHSNVLRGEETMKVIDPVCKMTIEEKDAVARSVYKESIYFFCSESCKKKFTVNPAAFLDKKLSSGEEKKTLADGAIFTCPMHPEVRQEVPGSCPKCGMALEPAAPSAGVSRTEWTCPMHPEIVRDAPGSCPKCGMALEPKTVSAEEEESPELIDMTRRFRISSVLTVPLVIIAMRHYIPGLSIIDRFLSPEIMKWLELILATPVVLWGAWPFFVRGWQSVVTWNPNMFTLIGLGVGVAYIYSVVAALFPDLFPKSFRGESGEVGMYFEAAAVIVTLVLLGQVMELRARTRTGAAIKVLLGLAPKTARRIQDGNEEDVPLDEIKPGDILRVRPGEKVPVDGTVTEG
ncbi:MAG: YHS domain-containing protein, partial [Nitrospirae bacterium]|nr:YHS domain-containing protein [Nitrospirota bacterium]